MKRSQPESGSPQLQLDSDAVASAANTKRQKVAAAWRGVSSAGSRWQATIHIGGQRFLLGKRFGSAEVAARAVDRATIAVEGREDTALNFPLDTYPPEENKQRTGTELADFLMQLQKDVVPEGTPGASHLNDGAEQGADLFPADVHFPTRCGVCAACRQPWLHLGCEAMAAKSQPQSKQRQQTRRARRSAGYDSEDLLLLQPLVDRADAAARERQLREQALSLRQLEAPADEAPLSLHRDTPPPPPVRTPQMDHGLTLRWAAAQAAQGVQHVTAVEASAGEAPPPPMKREHTCRRCRIVGHAEQNCPLVMEPDPQLEALPPELQQVLADMQGLANAGAAEHGLLDIQQTSKNDRFVQQQFSPNALVAAGLLVDEVMKRFGWGQGKPPAPPRQLPQQPPS